MRKEIKNKDMIITLSASFLIALIGWELLSYLPAVSGVINKIYLLMMPFIYAFVIAYVLNPIVKLFVNKFKLKQGLAITLTYLLFLGAVILFALKAIPDLYESVLDITSQIPGYIKEAQDTFYRLMEQQDIKDLLNSSGMFNNIQSMIAQVGDVSIKLLEGTVSHAFSLTTSLVNLGLGIIISIYVLADKNRFKKEGRRFLVATIKEKNTNYILDFLHTFHKMIGSYIGIKAIDSSIIGVMAFILLSIVGSEYPLFLSVIVAITNMIPYFGPFIGEIVGVLFNIFVSPTKALVVFLVLFGLQMFDGWYLDPKLVGHKVGVTPFFIILAVIIGGGFWGPIGMLLASPAVATLKIYYDKFIDYREEQLREEELAKSEIEK